MLSSRLMGDKITRDSENDIVSSNSQGTVVIVTLSKRGV